MPDTIPIPIPPIPKDKNLIDPGYSPGHEYIFLKFPGDSNAQQLLKQNNPVLYSKLKLGRLFVGKS